MDKLKESGFKEKDISLETMPIEPEPECRYYQFKQMIAPTIIKS